MIMYVTENSTYKVDPDHSMIMRLSSVHPATDRQGPDNEWKAYEELIYSPPGGLIIVWYYEGSVAKSTVTSRVISVDAMPDMMA